MSLQRSPSFASLFGSTSTRVHSPDLPLQLPSLMTVFPPSNNHHSNKDTQRTRTPDGPTNVTTNLCHLRVETKEQRRAQYTQFIDTKRQLITSAGQVLPFTLKLNRTNLFHHQVKKWLRDGEVSVSTHPCSQCVEMNSLRTPFQPPVSCIVRAKFKLDNRDGSGACAICYAMGKFQCSSRIARRVSMDFRTLPRSRTPSTSTQVDKSTTPRVSISDTCEFMKSADDVAGDRSAPESYLNIIRQGGKSSAFVSTGDEVYERDSFQTKGLHRTLTDASKRRARFADESGMGDRMEALEVLSSQMEALQMNWSRQNEKMNQFEETLLTHGVLLGKIQQRNEELAASIAGLQVNKTDQNASNFHLARLIEVVDNLQQGISTQKVKQGSSSKRDLVYHEPPPPPPETSQTLDDLRRFIDETEDKQRQCKALYLEQLNRELQRTMCLSSTSTKTELSLDF